jgi:transcription elongation factor Elf1
MKTMICAVCEQKKPVTELKIGRFCGMLVCDDCRETAEPNEEWPEEWTSVEEK